ncbi:unnamed protein product [Sphagnum balticum]
MRKMDYGGDGYADPSMAPRTPFNVQGAITASTGIAGSILNAAAPGDSYGVKSNGVAISSGALSGAGSGAALGSTLGPEGTLIGAGVGAIAGGISGLLKNKSANAAKNKAITQSTLAQKNYMDAQSSARLAGDPSLKYGNQNATYYRFGGVMKNAPAALPRTTKPLPAVMNKPRLMPNITESPNRQMSRMGDGGFTGAPMGQFGGLPNAIHNNASKLFRPTHSLKMQKNQILKHGGNMHQKSVAGESTANLPQVSRKPTVTSTHTTQLPSASTPPKQQQMDPNQIAQMQQMMQQQQGGIVQRANGGPIEQLSSQDAMINGPSHENGGVKFPVAGVELEGGETVNKGFVFSKKLGFAKPAATIARQLGKAEARPETAINTSTINALQRKTELLKVHQEAAKQALGIPNEVSTPDVKPGAYKFGGIMKKMADGGDGGPYPWSTNPITDSINKLMVQTPGQSSIRLPEVNVSATKIKKASDQTPRPNFPAIVPDTPDIPAGAKIPVTTTVPGTPDNSGNNNFVNTANKAIDTVSPFISNIYNATQRLPLPPVPSLNTPVTASLVNYDASRNEAVRQARSANRSARTNLNSGAAVSATTAANLAGQTRAVNQISEAENNQNATIRNSTAAENVQIAASNKALQNNYQNELVARQIKGQSLSSANMANLEEKVQGMARDKKMFDQEGEKTILGFLQNNDSGAGYDAARPILQKHLSTDQLKQMDTWASKMRADRASERSDNMKANKLQLDYLKSKNITPSNVAGNGMSTISPVPELNAYSGTMQKRYDTAADSDDNLGEALGNLQHLGLDADTQYANELKSQYYQRLQDRATSGDFENMSRRTRQDAIRFSQAYQPLIQRQKDYAEVVKKIQSDPSIANPNTKAALIQKFQYDNTPQRDPTTGDFQRDGNGRIQLGGIKDAVYAPDVDKDKIISELLEKKKADIRQTGFTSDGQGHRVSSIDEVLKPESMAALSDQIQRTNPGIAAMINRDVELQTYKLTPEQIKAGLENSDLNKSLYQQHTGIGHNKQEIEIIAKQKGYNDAQMKAVPLAQLRKQYQDQGYSPEGADRAIYNDQVAQGMRSGTNSMMGTLFSVNQHKLDEKNDEPWLLNFRHNLDQADRTNVATMTVLNPGVTPVDADAHKVTTNSVIAQQALEAKGSNLKAAIGAALSNNGLATGDSKKDMGLTQMYLNDPTKVAKLAEAMRAKNPDAADALISAQKNYMDLRSQALVAQANTEDKGGAYADAVNQYNDAIEKGNASSPEYAKSNLEDMQAARGESWAKYMPSIDLLNKQPSQVRYPMNDNYKVQVIPGGTEGRRYKLYAWDQASDKEIPIQTYNSIRTGYTPEDLGAANDSLANNPIAQAIKSRNAQLDSSLSGSSPTGKDSFNPASVGGDPDAYNKAVSRGAQMGSDIQDNEAKMQEAAPFGHNMWNMLGRALPGTAIKLAESVSNLGAGVAKIFGDGDLINNTNSWDQYLQQTSDELKAAMPIYASANYNDGSIKDKLLSSKFWTDDVADGFEFVLAQAIGAKGLGAAVGATGEAIGAVAKAANIGELYNAIPATEKIATAIANKFTTGTVGFLNAASISAMQAKGTANQIEQHLRQDYSQKINPLTGVMYTPDEIDQVVAKNKTNIDDKTSHTFWATMATELLPSIYASKLFLGASKAEMGELNTQIMKGVNSGKFTLADIESQLNPQVMEKAGFALEDTAVGKQLLKSPGKAALSEAGHAATVGTLAMNLQQAIQKYDVDQASVGGKENTIDSIGGYARQFLDNFTTDEGIKGLVMGSILGAATGAYGGFEQGRETNKAMTAHIMSMRASDALFGEIPKGAEKTDSNGKIQFDAQGNPIQDPEKLTKLVFQSLHNKNNWDNQTAAIISANQDMATMNDHVMLAQGIAHELQSNRYGTTDEAREFFKWFHGQRVKEQGLEAAKEAQDTQVADTAKKLAPDPVSGDHAAMETQSAMATGSAKGDATLSKRVNDSSQLIDKLFKLWDTAGKQSNKLTKLGESADRTDFNDNVKRSLYYEATKREAMKQMLLDREREMKEPGADKEGLNQQTEVLQNLMNDSDSRTSDFLNKHDKLFDEWQKDRKLRTDLYTDRGIAQQKFNDAGTEENARAKDTAAYKFEEYADKEGVNEQTGAVSTDKFLTNNNTSDILSAPIGSRNELQYKAGLDYMKTGRLSDMIDKVRSGKLPLKEAVSYATDNLVKLDNITRTKLNDLIKEQQSSVTSDEEKLSGMDSMTEDMKLNPEYSKLEHSIEERKQAISDSQDLLARKVKAEELETINRGPDKVEETLNKKFAERQFDKAINVISNAIDDEGNVKKEYADSKAVNTAIDRLTRMRNALEDRIKAKELNGPAYQYLIDRADSTIDRLKEIAESVVQNSENRKFIQQRIAAAQAHANVTGLGYNLENGEISSQPVFNATASILGGTDKLNSMLEQLYTLPPGSIYEGTTAILHAVKVKATKESMGTLLGLINDEIANQVNIIPDTKINHKFRTGLVDSPELHFSGLLLGSTEPGYQQIKLDKGTPLGDFLTDNDINAFRSAVDKMPNNTTDLGMPKESMLKVIDAYKSIVGLDRVRNLLNSNVDLSKTVTAEIKTANESSGIVPTAQQEISIRDGLAWLGSKEAVSTKPFDGWGFLRGIAGTGKTTLTVKWLLGLSGIKPEEILATAATEHAAGVLSGSTGGDASTFDKLMEDPIPSNKKLIILDEYARIDTDRLNEFEQKVREHNLRKDSDGKYIINPKDRIKVMILGDPTQPSPQRYTNQDIANPASNKDAKNIRVINPLTVVYRSDVSAVDEAWRLYQGNSKPVDNVSVRSDKLKGAPGAVGVQVASNSGDLMDTVKANIAAEKASGDTPRTRVVITEDTGKYAELAAMGVPIMSVYDSQSQTYQEAYVDLNAKDFPNAEKFNSVMYAGLSRAKEYAYFIHTNKDGSDPNMRDVGLTSEKASNDLQGSQAKADYLTKRAEEKAMMDKAVAGQSISVPKTEAAIEVAKAKSAPEQEANPIFPPDASAEAPEIVTELSSEALEQDQTDGDVDETDQELTPIVPVSNATALPTGAEQNLPNIEKGVDQALGARKQPQRIGAGSTVHYMYTEEPAGKDRTVPEPSITAFVIDDDGNWIPVSKVFKDEIEKIPKYKKWKDAIKSMQPVQFDPSTFNARSGYAAEPIKNYAASKLGEGVITKAQRLTYHFSKFNVKPTDEYGNPISLVNHIRNIFKTKYFSPRDAEQDKAKNVIFRIFRNNEFSGTNAHKFQENGFIPKAGIPYAIIGGKAETRDWRNAQFIRLTANPLSQDSEHYSTLKKFRDAVNDVAEATGKTGQRGIEIGTDEYNKMIRAARKGLNIEDDPTRAGNDKKVTINREFTREQFLDAYRNAGPKGEDFVDPIEHLSDDDAKSAIAKMQTLASMHYGVKEVETQYTKAEALAAHGEDYEHIPLRSGKTKTVVAEDGTETQEPLGYARLKGTGPKTGKPDQYATHFELDNKKGAAQIVFNQLAKANEYVGGTRIRVDEAKTLGQKDVRASRPTGKSLITGKGGDAQEWMPRKVLAKILGEIQVQEGKLSEPETRNKDTKKELESQIRDQFKSHEGSVQEFGQKLLGSSQLPEERKYALQTELNEALEAKDTPPVSMKTLDLMVGDENYENGQHLTQQEFNVKNAKGVTKQVRTYMRTPLDIDKFNKLGADPDANADDLSKMVGTKFNDLSPTQVSVVNKEPEQESAPVEKPEPVEKVTTVPADKIELQNRIEEYNQKIADAKNALERVKLRKEQQRLIDERDSTSRMFDQSEHRTDVGDKITAQQATDEIRRMLPGIKDSEINFLTRSLMLELQQPGESLLGLYQKGKMFFKQDENGNVFSNVVRHEVFHKVYNDYLSERDRANLSKEFDPEGKMNPLELEETLADKFMVWKQQPEAFSGKIKRIFNKIASWLGFAQSNAGIVDKLFNDIQEGKFQKVDPDTANVRRAFSDISKWGTIADYKNAARFLQNMVYDHFVDEHIDKMPLTQPELVEAIQADMVQKLNETSDIINARFQDNNELLDMLSAEDTEDGKTELIDAIKGNNADTLQATQKADMLKGFLQDPKMFQDIWKDLYPNFSFKGAGILSLVEDDPQTDDPEATTNEKESSLYADYVQSADEKNQETKISQNVKNFLSFIYRPGRDKNGNVTRVNPRGVYLLALRNLSNMEAGAPDFIEQLQKRAAQNGIKLDSKQDAALVINKLIDLYNNATNKNGEYVFNKGRNDKGEAIREKIKLPETGRFLDENTFIKSINGESLAGATEYVEGKHILIERDGRSTADFLNEVTSTNVSMDQAKGYFRQYQAQETLREVMSNFTSQREAIPMIAEETRDYTTTLKYFRAQIKGEERVQTANIEDGFKTNWNKAVAENWKAFEKADPQDKGTAIANLMKSMGLDAEHVRNLSSNLVEAVHSDLKGFKSVVDNTKSELSKVAAEDASDTDEQVAPADPVYTALEQNTNMLNRLTQLMSLTSSDNRAGAYIDAKGTKKYLFHNGSQAHDIVSRIIRAVTDGIGSMPKHLVDDKILSKNIFANGINRITSMLDHDGYKQKGKEEFALSYSDESNKNWLERNFSYGFLSYLGSNTSNNDGKTEYVQPFYTISNRPRMNMATVEVLPEAKIHDALIKGIEQHVEQPDTKLIRNYDRFKAVNFDEFHKAIEALHDLKGKSVAEHLWKTEDGTDNTPKRSKEDIESSRKILGDIYDKIAGSDEMKSELASHMVGQLKELAEKSLQRMKKEGVVLGADATKALKGLKDPRRQILTDDQLVPGNTADRNQWPSDDEMRPAVETYYMNNYVNSYFLNQAVAGNMNYFKDALDMVKRMSGVFAPGTKGLVGKFFMNPKFNVAISSDPKMNADMLSPIFNDTELKKALAKEGFDLADAQGFMTQQRADNIIQGFGKNYKAGAVFKPAHYENVPRTLEDGSVIYTPVMLKYSSVILSDDLIKKFPKLAALDAEMKAKGADEFVFNTGVKAGAPVDQVKLPGATDYGNNKITISPNNIVTLSNENYRLQLNPTKEAYDTVANPTQLGYFLNVMHNKEEGGTLNKMNADRVYQAVAEKMARGIEKLGRTVLDKDGAFTVESIKKGLTGPGNERIQEMLGVLHNLNMPNAADKSLIQMAGIVDKAAPKIEFPGGKMVLQSSYGADISDTSDGKNYRRLEYKQETNADGTPGRWHAEVLLPEIYRNKANPGDFVLPDGMGFRIPSTELHSSVPLKVAGYYDSKGSNVIIAPAELVAQHGSDFDVDSLSVITREQASSDAWETGSDRKIIEKGQPVGYYKNDDGKYEFDRNRFLNHINGQKELNANNPKFLAKLEKLHDQMLTNQITEAFLDTISHPDNKDRMLTPISTQVIKDTLDELGIAEDKNVNLSRLEDNLKVYNSNFQGASLTGVFANGPKALSYLSRSGPEGSYPQLTTNEEGVAAGAFEWNGHTYDKFTEDDHEGGNLWKQLDSFINTAVDNVKEQYLSLMNATDKTGPAYIAAKAMGMPLKEAIRMMKQPVIKMFSEQSGGKQTAMDNLKKAIVAHAMTIDKEDGTKLLASGQGYADLRNALKGTEYRTDTEYLDSQLSSNLLGDTPGALAHQVKVLESFEKVNQIGQDLSTFSSAISILQNMPVFYEDVQTKVDQWQSMGQVIDGKLSTNPNFSFNIDNLLQAQPNIAEAYNAFQFMKTGADKTLIKHFPEMKALVDNLADSRLLSDNNANREKIKNEVMSYLISTHYSEELKNEKSVTVGKDKNVVLTGKNAWSQRFTGDVAKAIKKDKDNNAFLKRISVKKGLYGDSIRFANSSNPDAEESLEMQEAFNAIPDDKLKQNFVKYAVLNFGLNFGMRNYSMFIPPEYLRPISEYISKNVKDMVTNSTVDAEGKLIAGPLNNIRDNIAIKMAVNNPDKLPFISSKKTPPIQSTDADGKPKTVEIGDRIVPVLSGYNGSYYWHRAYDNPDSKPESEDKFPEFIKQRDGNSREVVYRRINDVTIDDKAYYQRVAYKNFLGGYDGSLDTVRNGYNPDDYFAKGTIPVPVADIRTDHFEAVNEHIKEGSRVIVYPYSNATRENGISGIVAKVTDLGKGKVSFTLGKAPDMSKELDDKASDIISNWEKQPVSKGVQALLSFHGGQELGSSNAKSVDALKAELANQVLSKIEQHYGYTDSIYKKYIDYKVAKNRVENSKELEESTPDINRDHLLNLAAKVIEPTGLKLAVSDKLPEGVKGTYQDGVVTLNPKLVTADTVFHEVSHPLLAAIEEKNPVWFQNLKTELHNSTEGRAVLNKVVAKYPELSPKAQEMEALVTAQGLEAARRLEDSSFRTMIQRLMRSIGNTLKGLIGKPTGINLDNIGSADMVKLSMGDIAEMLAGGKVDLSKLSSDENDVQYSKDLTEDKPVKNSVMAKLLELAKNIIDPVKNEHGQEADTYTVNGESAARVSRAMDDLTFRTKKESLDANGKSIPAEDAIAQRDADRMYRNVEPGGKLIIDGIEKTKEEYQEEKKTMLLTGIAKGNIIHAKIQRFLAVLKGDAASVSELDSKIEVLSSQVDKLPTAYDWVTKKGVFNKLMSNAGVNIGSHIPKSQEDQIHSEVKIASPILGIAGKVDMLVEKPDGRLRVVDWKTGSKLKDKYSSTILKYGYQSTRITDNPLDRAKLQIMMYALAIKAEHPETKFDGLVVMHLPNELEATMGRNALAVDIPSYLKMLEQYYRHEKPEIYKQLMEKSPAIFDPREYNAPLKADFAQEVMNSNGSSELEVKQKMELELQQLEYDIKSRREENALKGPTDEQLQRRSELVKMIAQANDLYGTDFSGALDPAYEIKIMKQWMATLDNIHNPYIQSLNAHLKVRQDRANRELATVQHQFETLLKPVIKERIGDRGLVSKALTHVDQQQLFANFYTTKVITDDSGAKYIRRGMTNPEDHPTEYAKMSANEKALSDFMRTTMKDKYEKVMTKGEFAIIGKDALGKDITKEDLYNSSRKGANFKYTADFFPKLLLTKEEVAQRFWKSIGEGDFSKVGPTVTNAWRRFATDFFDNNAEGYNQRDYGMSVRYLGNSNTDAIPDGYSMNLEHGYLKFMEQMIKKDHLDSTYMYGQAVKGVLENATDGNGNPAFKLSAALVNDQLRNILMGDTLNRGKGQFIRHGFALSRRDGQEHTVSILKIFKSLKTAAAASTLWLQPQRSAVNLVQSAYMYGKEAIVNDIVAWANKKEGLALGRDISREGMAKNYAEAVAGQVAAFSGNGKSNFVHQLAKELKLYNNLEEEGGKKSQYLTKGATLLDTSNFGFMYRMPEEIANVQYALNYMKNLKIQSGKYAGKSMYDMYKENFNKETGKFELPADFKRGTIQHGDGTTEDLAGLHPLEINKIHAGIGKIMGNYRNDEKTALQMTILGDAMMMFKRWIPGMAIQQYQSKFNDPTMGSFELAGKSLEQKPGEDTYQWRSRVVEGRMKTLGGFLLHLTGMSKFDGYAWSDLSSEQRKGLVDSGAAIASWLAFAIGAKYTIGQKKDNDTLKKFYESVEDRVQEEIWLPTMAYAAIQPPAAVKKLEDVTKALWMLLGAGTSAATGGENKDIYTERGDIRGMNELLKNVPLLSSAYEVHKSWTNWDKDDNTSTTSPF